MLIWLFALFCAAGTFAYAQSIWDLATGLSLVVAVAVGIAVRGLFSLGRRWLILHERIADDLDADRRTVEVNRAIFWRRVSVIGVLLGLYLGIVVGLLQFTVPEAFQVLPGLVLAAFSQVAYFLIFMIAQFMIFFGPFLLYSRIGRESVEPGDADYDVRVEDVRGQASAVEEMRRILKLMEQGRNYVKAGGKRERGVLMVGPPGTGKTMLAKGIASSLHVPIIVTSGAAFIGMFMGMDVLSVYMMVRAAKKKAKRWGGCVVFIDEFDALGSRRSGMPGGPGGMGPMGMMGGFGGGLNMLLVLMDGVDNPGFWKKLLRRTVNVSLDGLFVPRTIGGNGSSVSLRIPQLKPPLYNIFFLGATNRPSVLDEAVTRPGRFGRTITFRMPTRENRKDIAELYFDKKKHDLELDTPTRRDEFARVTEHYSPAMIEQALSLALMYAFEDGRDAFTWKDLREAMGNIEAGLAQPVVYSERDQIAIARHELGHAVAARFYKPDHAHARLSIRMRSESLGHHRTVEMEEQFVKFRSQLAGEVRHILGAIAAERVFYGENSSGVFSDLIMATQQACHMVGLVGMGPEDQDRAQARRTVAIGEQLISAAHMSGSLLETGSVENTVLANATSRRVVAQILGTAYTDDWRLIQANREAIDTAAEALIAQGELMGSEIDGLLDSVGLREVREADPYPPLVEVPPAAAAEKPRSRTA